MMHEEYPWDENEMFTTWMHETESNEKKKQFWNYMYMTEQKNGLHNQHVRTLL